MWEMIWPLLAGLVAAYFLGNMNGAVIMSSLLDRDDVRSHGSGNAGMTNYMRNYGVKKTVLVVLVDLGKSLLAAYLVGKLMEPYGMFQFGAIMGGLFVTLGHDFPLALGFKGGKGILCGLGASIVTDWRVAAIILSIFILVVLLTRYVSLGSVIAALSLGIFFTIYCWNDLFVIVPAWIIACLAIFMHRGNIQRLLSGTERRLGHKGEKK